ncbi:phage portal protein [Endozoicomonas lisbonensis]|uniref:Lambda family phage portal protein n=1 Tax=Endozoicomonas lisbonensis TaxID=3120522 RepID=A0ABV2SHG5_9GAMM
MNILDRIIAPFAPEKALNRLRARAQLNILAQHEAAQPSRTRKTKRSSGSGDAVALHGKSLREQARWLDENYDLAAGILDEKVKGIIGAKGILIEPAPKNNKGEILTDFAAELSRLHEDWSRSATTCGMARTDAERVVCLSWLRDGDMLGQMVQGRVNVFQFRTSVPLAIELLEADYLPAETTIDSKNNIVGGVERNAWGQPTAFHIYKDHPGNVLGNWNLNTKRVPADRILHLKLTRRSRQARGISLLAPVIQRLGDLRDYEHAEQVAAKVAAALTAYIKKGEPAMYNQNQGDDERSFDLGPLMVFDNLQAGEEVGTVESNRPSALLTPYRDAMLKAACAGTASSYSTVSRTYMGSYSSQRQELVDVTSTNAVFQDQFINNWTIPSWEALVRVSIAAGLVKPPKELDARTLFDAEYLGPVMPWIDPVKESNSWKQNVRNGHATDAEAVRARGRNPAVVRAKRLKEVERNREDGLVTDTDPYYDKPEKATDDAQK